MVVGLSRRMLVWAGYKHLRYIYSDITQCSVNNTATPWTIFNDDGDNIASTESNRVQPSGTANPLSSPSCCQQMTKFNAMTNGESDAPAGIWRSTRPSRTAAIEGDAVRGSGVEVLQSIDSVRCSRVCRKSLSISAATSGVYRLWLFLF